jgi:hypothetical protein
MGEPTQTAKVTTTKDLFERNPPLHIAMVKKGVVTIRCGVGPVVIAPVPESDPAAVRPKVPFVLEIPPSGGAVQIGSHAEVNLPADITGGNPPDTITGVRGQEPVVEFPPLDMNDTNPPHGIGGNPIAGALDITQGEGKLTVKVTKAARLNILQSVKCAL